MTRKSKRSPFEDRYNLLVNDWGLQGYEAIREIENDRSSFDQTHQLQKRIHLDATNKAELSRIAHTTTLATLTMTVVGLMSTQFSEGFNSGHKVILMLVIVSEVVSLFFGMWDYHETITFHASWAKTHDNITNEVSKKFDSGDLQTVSDMIKIQNKHLQKQRSRTNTIASQGNVFFVLFGLIMVALLFYAYFFDVPGSW